MNLFAAQVYSSGARHEVHQLCDGYNHALAPGRHGQAALQPMRLTQVHCSATPAAALVNFSATPFTQVNCSTTLAAYKGTLKGPSATSGVYKIKPLCNPFGLHRYTDKPHCNPYGGQKKMVHWQSALHHSATFVAYTGKPLCNPCGFHR